MSGLERLYRLFTPAAPRQRKPTRDRWEFLTRLFDGSPMMRGRERFRINRRLPHQGAQECARRVRQGLDGQGAGWHYLALERARQ